jgi:hypothetical protein
MHLSLIRGNELGLNCAATHTDPLFLLQTPQVQLLTTLFRIRHVKCDEGSPACNKCVSTGRTCDFLSPPSHLAASPPKLSPKKAHFIIVTDRTIHPKPAFALFPDTKYSSTVTNTDFDYFRTICATSFSAYFTSTLWNQIILQLSHSEHAVWCAITAIATVHRSRAMHRNDVHAERQYLAALKALNRRLSNGGGHVEKTVALVGSLLLGVFEVLRGMDVPALKHLEGGLSILKESSTPGPVSLPSFQRLSYLN